MGWSFSWAPRLAQRRTLWWPTWIGWCAIAVLLVIPAVWWFLAGDSFLSLTQRLPADVLVVEGWIGRNGVRAAAAEFEQRGYQYVVTSGGWSSGRWQNNRSSYAELARRELIQSGVPENKIIVATSKDTESRRTFESAAAAFQALQARHIKPKTLNMFTCGPHARRSQLVFAKVRSWNEASE